MRQYINKCFNILNSQGIGLLLRRMHAHLKRRLADKKYVSRVILPSIEEMKGQSSHITEDGVLFSIIVPIYNTPVAYLRDMIRSCCEQTYGQWELCIVDGSDSIYEFLESFLKKAMASEPRIRYKRLNQNRGIAENTNIAFEMAKGDYFVLLDHDDMLHPAALYEYAKAIKKWGADFIYCDEAVFKEEISNVLAFHFKPDFSPDSLRGNNYICHLIAFSRGLYNITGGMRKEYDGAQDYDMVFRLTEQAKRIMHIPRVLYFWRSHSQSVAESIDAKQYAVIAGKRAVESHMERCALSGEVISSQVSPTIYKVRYDLLTNALISIVVWKQGVRGGSDKCLDFLKNKLVYSDYEIIIADVTWNISQAVKDCRGEYILFLDDDLEIISSDILEQMLMFAQRDDVGCVGAKIYNQKEMVYHGGIVFDRNELRYGNFHYGYPQDDMGYMGRLLYAQNFSAVSEKCMMISRENLERAGGNTEGCGIENYGLSLCAKLRQMDKLVVWTPDAEVICRNKSRVWHKGKRLLEMQGNQMIWGDDPYFNCNLECVSGAIIARCRQR